MESLQPKTAALGDLCLQLEHSLEIESFKEFARTFLSFLGHWHRLCFESQNILLLVIKIKAL